MIRLITWTDRDGVTWAINEDKSERGYCEVLKKDRVREGFVLDASPSAFDAVVDQVIYLQHELDELRRLAGIARIDNG